MVSQLAKFDRICRYVLNLPIGLVCVLVSACALSQEPKPESSQSGCQGPNCYDAGPTVLPGLEPPASRDAAPATVDAASSLPEVCRGSCSIGDPEQCSNFGKEIEKRHIDDRSYQFLLLGVLSDAGALQLDGGPDAAVSMEDPEGTLNDAGIGFLPDAGHSGAESYSCQLSVSEEQTLSASCSLAGSGVEGDSCTSSSDCRSGFGCVAVGGVGQCLPYCCGGDADCQEGRFCAQRPLRLGGSSSKSVGTTQHMVPVCAKAEQCRLGEPFPCVGEDCGCTAELTCTVVSEKGTTGCVMPGAGKEEQECPCAPGYFCSQASRTCLKLCDTQSPNMCEGLTCQPGPNFPSGWGLCVGLRESPSP